MDYTRRLQCLCTLLCLGLCVANFDITPQNEAVVAGERVTFRCQPSVSGTSDYSWRFSDGGDNVPMTLGTRIYPPYLNLIDLEVGTSHPRSYNLVINSTAKADAKQYNCHVAYPLSNAFAELIVLDQKPICQATRDVSDLVEGESFGIECSAFYKAKWDAVLMCKDLVSQQDLPPDYAGSVPGSILRATLPVNDVGTSLQDHIISCKISFPVPPLGTIAADTDVNKYSRSAPIYSYIYNTSKINVQYAVRNLVIDNEKSGYVPGEQVTCGAQGWPSVQVRWVNANTSETEVSGRDLLITAGMEGFREYRCEVQNRIRNVLYTVNKTISFTVTIPTTTTTTTPEPTTTASTVAPSGPGGLNGGHIAAIVIGVLLALIILFIILYILLRRRAPSKGIQKEKKKPRMDGVDAVRRQVPPAVPAKPAQPYDSKPNPNHGSGQPKNWGESLTSPMYDVALDDTPRSRKPVQVYDTPDYSNFERV